MAKAARIGWLRSLPSPPGGPSVATILEGHLEHGWITTLAERVAKLAADHRSPTISLVREPGRVTCPSSSPT
jgi:hypothetical protein